MIGLTWFIGCILMIAGLFGDDPIAFITGASLMGLCALKGEAW